jgi:adenine-specific DNA-methyltransferase
VVIGNPPYIQISKLDETLKRDLAKMKFETFSSSGDIYELFYENGNRVLANGGHLCFITSNKWLRANYGTSTRKFFLTKTTPKLLFDFGQEMIFSSAIVHSNILLFQKGRFKNEFRGCQLSKAKLNSLVQYFKDNAIKLDYFNEEVWAISTQQLIKIKSRLEDLGVKLKNWDLGFYRGILTGYNDAFIIHENAKSKLEKNEPNLKKIIKPILRGRDTRRYYCNYHNLYLINSHNGDKRRGIKRIDIPNDFPKLLDYLRDFPKDIQTRSDKGDHWTNLRNCAFLEEVEKDKIVFSEIVSEPQFYFDTQKYYPEATAFLITGENLKWLTAFLNSQLITVLFRIFYAGGELVGKYRYKKAFLENLPIPEPKKQFEPIIEMLVDYLGLYKGVYKDQSKEHSLAAFFESVVDGLVYEVVFPEEIKSAGKEIVKHMGDLKPITDDMSEEKKLAIIQSEFERLYDPNHPVRFAIETLDSVEEVRIIKEALK